MKYLAQRDYRKYQPYGVKFGEEDKNGWIIEGDTARDAIERWNLSQVPGNRLNPFYLKFTEIRINSGG